jgi:hypothetical protein
MLPYLPPDAAGPVGARRKIMSSVTGASAARPSARRRPRAGAWLCGSRSGPFAIAAVVGAGSGLAAVGFRYFIYLVTWIATGHVKFGQNGLASSLGCTG